MKKRIQVTIDESLLEALESELQRLQREKGISRSKSSVIEEALSDWISWQREIKQNKFVNIGFDENGGAILIPREWLPILKKKIKQGEI